MARSNGELIAKARQLAEDVGRRPATVAEAREMLGRRDARRRRGADGGRRMSAAAARSTGIRVLDLSRLLPGGFCSLLLADFGAEVLKVEDTGMGDYVRWSPPYVEGAEDTARSALFLSLNRNKRSIRLDLKSEAGTETLLQARARTRRGAGVLPPGRARPPRRRLRAPRAGEPRPRLLRDHRLRPGRPQARRRRPRHELPRRSSGCSGSPASAAARRSRRPGRSPTSAAAR